MITQWKRFQFFDKELLKPAESEEYPDFGHDLDEELQHQDSGIGKIKYLTVTCTTSGRGHIFLGDSDGVVYLIDRQLNVSSFRAFDVSITHLLHVPQTTFLVSVGSDEEGINPLVKFWNLDKWSSHETDGRKPLCTRVIRAVVGSRPVPVTCVNTTESLAYLAVGFEDGSLILHRGDVTREKFSKQKFIKVGDSAITGLAFGDKITSTPVEPQMTFLSSPTPVQAFPLFVSTDSQIFSYVIRVDKDMRFVLDELAGAAPRCWCLMNNTKKEEAKKSFVVGRKDAVYFYQPEGRGQCLVFDGDKELITTFRNYLVVVSREKAGTLPVSQTPIILNASEAMTPHSLSVDCKVTIYDLDNKFEAYSSLFTSVVDVIVEWGSLYVLCKDGRLFKLTEKDITSKLDLLFRKSQYSLAMDLAKTCNYDSDQLAEISRHYADFLYKKGDYDAAVSQYSKTIGVLEPSYVIRKFLDSKRIQNLTTYLQQLLARKLGNEDHTTLLINCYAKLKDDEQLNKLTSGAMDVDIETAIKVLRNANFPNHAAKLAALHGKHDWFMRICLEDRGTPEDAIEHLVTEVRESDRLCLLIKYGRLLMEKQAAKTTELAIQLTCRFLEDSSLFSLTASSDTLDPMDPGFVDFNLDDLLNIFILNKQRMLEFLEAVIETYPTKATPSFYSTLLGLHLRSFSECQDEDKKKPVAEKALEVLQRSGAPYDIDQAIVLCSSNSFDEGLLYLYLKSKRFAWIQRHYILKKMSQEVVQSCRDFGHLDTSLWVNALWYFGEGNEPTDDQQIPLILENIERLNLLPPLSVIDILCRNDKLSLACISKYMIRFLNAEQGIIADNDKLILQYKEETDRMKSNIQEMQTTAKVFQASKCSCCSKSLELPSVHFYCGHSYHQACFESYSAEHDSDCPLCLPDNNKVMSQIKQRKPLKDQSERLREQLLRPDCDVISIVSSYLSKGILQDNNKKK